MDKEGRYNVSHLTEAQYEPGSGDTVLKNLLGINAVEEMDRIETEKLQETMDRLVRMYDAAHVFTANDICEIHKSWLGDIYEWAGNYRQVNVSKGSFPFAAAAQVPKLMQDFDRQALRRHTPCDFESRDEVINALAETHVELVLIHPFREGNGRIARVLSTLALQAGLPLLNFSDIAAGEKKEEYFAAVRAGLDRNYEPMKKIFSEIIEKSLLSL